LWGRIVNRPVQLTASHTYWTSLPLAQCVYRLSDGGYGSPPRFCAGRRRGDDAFVHLHDANLGVVVGGVRLDQPYCRAVEECVEEMLRDYRREVERLREPPEPALVVKIDPVEELPWERPELGAFGVEWVKKWLDLRERLVEIAKTLRRFPWMVDVVRQRPMSILHPYMVEMYVARDGSEACISLTSSKAFCARNGAVKETKLELEFKRYETYEDKTREVYGPKGLLAFAAAAREYARLI
jgi:hypothetical protein